MNWKTFLSVVVVVYILYYGINILLDITRKKKNPKKKGENYNVDMELYPHEEDETTEVVYSKDYFDRDFDLDMDQEVEHEVQNFERVANNEREIIKNEDKQFQAMPVDEFLKRAKELALEVDY